MGFGPRGMRIFPPFRFRGWVRLLESKVGGNASGRAKHKRDRLSNRGEARRKTGPSTAAIRTRIFSVQLLDVEFGGGKKFTPAAPPGTNQVLIVSRVSAPLPKATPQQPYPLFHELQPAIHQPPSAHCVAMYGVSYRAGAFFPRKTMYHCTMASAMRTRIITARTAVTAASSR